MKRFLKTLGLVFVGLLFLISPAQAGYDHYTITVYKDIGYTSSPFGYPAITTGIQYLVLDNGAVGHETDTTFADLKGPRGLTSMSNPVNFDTFDAVGMIDFYLEDTETSCDIIIVDNDGGYSLYMDNVTPSVHAAIINERPNIEHHGQIWFSLYTDFIWSGISTTTDALGFHFSHTVDGPYDTGIDFHVGTMIRDVAVEMIIPCKDSGDTDLTVGYSSLSRAFRSPCETDAAGIVETLWTGTTTFGDSLYTASSLFLMTAGDGVYIPKTEILREACSLNYAVGSGDHVLTTITDETHAGWGFIHYFFTPLRR